MRHGGQGENTIGIRRAHGECDESRPSVIAVLSTRTAKSVRSIELPDDVVVALERHRERQAVERSAAGDGW